MLDLKECTYNLYSPVFERLAPGTQRKIKAAYDSRESYLERVGFVVYAAHSLKARRLGASFDAALFHLEKQAKDMSEIGTDKMVEALRVLEKYNTMNMEYIRYKREHSDEPMPYVMFEPCFWYIEALRLLKVLTPEDYPLMNCWQEFFMFLPLSGEIDIEDRSGIQITLMNYVRAVEDGIFDKWYQREKGYGPRLSQFARGGFKEMYAGELEGMSMDELKDEFEKFNWGHQLVKAELARRKG